MGQPIEGRRQQPLPLKDMYPDIEAKRVRGVMNEPEFQAKTGIMELHAELGRMEQGGQDVKKAKGLLEESYLTAMTVLSKELTRKGWSMTEQSAARQAVNGQITLPE